MNHPEQINPFDPTLSEAEAIGYADTIADIPAAHLPDQEIIARDREGARRRAETKKQEGADRERADALRQQIQTGMSNKSTRVEEERTRKRAGIRERVHTQEFIRLARAFGEVKNEDEADAIAEQIIRLPQDTRLLQDMELASEESDSAKTSAEPGGVIDLSAYRKKSDVKKEKEESWWKRILKKY